MSRRVQTVEQTGKLWKAGQGCGCFTVIVAAVGAVIAGQIAITGSGPTAALPWVLGMLCGLSLYIISRVAAWWFHG